MAKSAAEFDLILFGASGFTGRLIVEYLALKPGLRWALAGRSAERLRAACAELNLLEHPPILEADAGMPAELATLCSRTRLVLTTVGPYQLYGSELVAACASSGTDYVDLCGEPIWMQQMIEKYEEAARASGARIVFSCGFDSIPFDLGVYFLQAEARKKWGQPLAHVQGRVCEIQGGASGGTMASMKATLKATFKNPALMAVLKDPFALTPGFKGPDQPSGLLPELDKESGVWAVPFVMAAINTKNVHRTNFLLNFPYGRDFVYDEMQFTDLKQASKALLDAAAKASPFSGSGLKPGDGPSREVRENGHYEVLFKGRGPDGTLLQARVHGDRDPGYGSTSKIISEAALYLIEKDAPGGIFTPGALLAPELINRLGERAGLTFRLEN